MTCEPNHTNYRHNYRWQQSTGLTISLCVLPSPPTRWLPERYRKMSKLFGYQIYPKLTANGKGMAEKYLDDKNRRNTYYYMGVVIEGERNNSTNIGYQSQSSILMYYSDIFISHSLIACRNTPKVNYINWEKTWHSNPVSHSPIKPKKHNSIIIEILYRKMFSFSFGLKFKKFETKSGINFFWIKG